MDEISSSGSSRSPRPRRRPVRRRGCERCRERGPIDYKDAAFLKQFIEPNGRMLPAQKTGCTARCQHRIAQAIQRARFLALLPYTSAHARLANHRAS